MSLGARATKGGAKGKDRAQDKGKADKPQPKEKVKPQATTEQLRMATMIDRKADDTADVRKMVKMVQDLMEMTCRTEEEVCSALHDSDNDVVAACNLLLETEHTVTGEWQTNEKKKKKPAAPTNNGELEPSEPRSRSGPRPRRGSGERGDRGEGPLRGRGSGRGGRGAGRGGRGGGRGARAPRARPDRHHDLPHHAPPADSNPMGDTFPATEDWDNEEWSGSLSDTKVFTPSVNPQPAMDGDTPQPLPVTTEDWEASEPPAPAEGHIPTYTYHNPAAHHVNMEQLGGVEAPAAAPHLPPDAFLHQHQHQHQHQPHAVQPRGMSGSLTAAQSQYLEQLTQQSQRHDSSVYTTNYGVYGSDMAGQRKPQRARVPPPSKIPSSAVEMPGGGEAGFLDVQFGALDDLPDPPKPAPAPRNMPAAEACPEPAPAPLEPAPLADPAPVSYANANTMLSESLAEASQPAPAPEPVVTNSTSSLEKQLTASMKQLSVSAADSPPMHLAHLQQHRPKPPTVSTNASPSAASVSANASASANVSANVSASANATQNMYSHHPVSHHPPAVYSANVYAPQVNSSNASLSAGGALPQAYPSSVTLTQYQPIINSYQTSSSAAAYNSSALYTAAPYTAYQPPAAAMPKQQPKDNTPQYDSSAAAVSNSLTSTSTTQTSTAKVTTTSGHVPVTGGSSSGAAYAGGALYGSQGYAYDEQLMRSTMPHHMGGYYEVTGYGVGVGGAARDGAFGLGAGDRFARSDAASPQQVPTAALPPGYAYYYQPPPPTTYQYGVYPNVSDLRVQFGGGSGVGGAAAGKVPAYQQQYDAQDSYKPVAVPGGGYSGAGGKAAAASSADLSNVYAKGHVALNKVNSYEKAGFHSGTPPPFGATSHLFIAAPPHHHHHAPQHQMDARMNSSQNRRGESGSSGGRGGSNKPTHNKPAYTHSYWPSN